MPAPQPARRLRRPDRDVLYAVVRDNLETLLVRAREADRPLPAFVEKELRAYLACGIPAHGVVRLRCAACRHDQVVALSCKGRGICPSCCGRRMNQLAAHLVDRVLPNVPVRQWVLSVPFPLRLWLARNTVLRRAVERVLMQVVFGWYQERARRQGIADPRCGAVAASQFFGSLLNLNVHWHVLVLDGVYAWDPQRERPVFHALGAPSTRDVQRLVCEVRVRVEELLEDRDAADSGPDDGLEDGQLPMQQASVAGRVVSGSRAGAGVRRVGSTRAARPTHAPSRCAEDGWFNLHANTRIGAGRRDRLERLCRYILRPPVPAGRLRWGSDGNVVLDLTQPLRDGTTALVLSPMALRGRTAEEHHATGGSEPEGPGRWTRPGEMLEKLVALIPRPRKHMLTYWGVLIPCSQCLLVRR